MTHVNTEVICRRGPFRTTLHSYVYLRIGNVTPGDRQKANVKRRWRLLFCGIPRRQNGGLSETIP